MSSYAASLSIPYPMDFTGSGIMDFLPMDTVAPSWRSYASNSPTQTKRLWGKATLVELAQLTTLKNCVPPLIFPSVPAVAALLA